MSSENREKEKHHRMQITEIATPASHSELTVTKTLGRRYAILYTQKCAWYSEMSGTKTKGFW